MFILVRLFSLFTFLLFTGTYTHSSNYNDDVKDDYHRHTPKDVSFMKINTNREQTTDYEVDNESFNKIHPPLSFQNPGFSLSTGQIVCPDDSYGTGTVVKVNPNLTSEILTAKHIVYNAELPMFPVFYQGRTALPNNKIAHLAKHEIDEVCVNPNNTKDIALLKGKIVENNMGEDLYKTPSPVQHKETLDINEKIMNHYPFGTFIQRYNTGSLYNGYHTISSLPGSSGAGIRNQKDEIEHIHSSGGESFYPPIMIYYNLSSVGGYISEMQSKSELLKNNKSYSIVSADLDHFTQCIKKAKE